MITPTTPLAEDSIGSRTIHSLDTIRGYDRPFSRVSWGAIFAGAVIALATQIVLTLLGLSIGLAALDPVEGTGGLGIGAAIWMIITGIASLFAGGYFAGRLAGTFNGWAHGLLAWAAATILTLMLLTTAMGRIVGAATGFTRIAAQYAPLGQVQLPPQAQSLLNQAQILGQQPAEREAAQTAERVAERAADAGAASAFWTFFTLILGAAAAAFGGKLGWQYPPHRREDHDIHDEGSRGRVHAESRPARS